MKIFTVKFNKEFIAICFVVSLLITLKLLFYDSLTLGLEGRNFHRPICYIRQSVDIWKMGLAQKFYFKNKKQEKYNIELRFYIADFNPFRSAIFDGEYKVSIFDDKKSLIYQVYAANDILRKSYFKIYVHEDIGGAYYVLSEDVLLEKISSYELQIENLKELSTYKNVRFELLVSPYEYNKKIQERNFAVELIVSIAILITSFILIRKQRRW